MYLDLRTQTGSNVKFGLCISDVYFNMKSNYLSISHMFCNFFFLINWAICPEEFLKFWIVPVALSLECLTCSAASCISCRLVIHLSVCVYIQRKKGKNYCLLGFFFLKIHTYIHTYFIHTVVYQLTNNVRFSFLCDLRLMGGFRIYWSNLIIINFP